MTKNSAQIDKSTDFQTVNGKNVLITEKGKKRIEALLNEFHKSDDDIDNNILCIKNKVISEKRNMLCEKSMFNKQERRKNVRLSQFSSKLSAACSQTDDTPLLALDDESKQAVLNSPMLFGKKRLLSLTPKLNFRPPTELCQTFNRNLLQTETTTPELGEFAKNAVETSTPLQEMEKDNDAVLMANRPKRWRLRDLSRTRTNSKKYQMKRIDRTRKFSYKIHLFF
ncbi:uncharacterized protein LOC119641790 [Glossina fuscipes]|uniref:Uncharacterized protein LOC119641790 n=1 Tax=Glossina fuscipes TaxID=7396 RepID=A0A9C6E181_9MUSC|nr:uncharacterized protein LOC119641790 [Glossina fuscipes]